MISPVMEDAPALDRNERADAVVAGSGIAACRLPTNSRGGTGRRADARFIALEAWMRNFLPLLATSCTAAGQIQNPIDYCGFIGRNPGEILTFVATRDSGQGITQGTVAGILISDRILKGVNPWTDLYDPARRPLKRPPASSARTSRRLRIRVRGPGELSSWEELKPGRARSSARVWARSPPIAMRTASSSCLRPQARISVPFALKQFRALLGLPVRRLPIRPGWHALNGPAFSILSEYKPSSRILVDLSQDVLNELR